LSAKGIPDEQILSINFDITGKIKNKDTYYIFLDEIQSGV